MRLSALAASVKPLEIRGTADPEIASLEYDSRKVVAGSLFIAFPGIHADGQAYIEAAIDRGAAAIVHEKPLSNYRQGIVYLRLADARLSMSKLASAFNGRPSASLRVVGVTGTEGKSTTVYLIWQLLNLAGHKAGFFSTVMSDTGSGEAPNPEHQTTPEATSVQAMLASMRDALCEYAVVEASSHGLSERTGRLSDVDFDVGVVTNVTHEHLEFHGTWENYRSDKANLFRKLDGHDHRKKVLDCELRVPSFGVANADDPSASYFASATAKHVFSYSDKGRPADYRALAISSDKDGSSFTVEGPDGSSSRARINLPGQFNVGNSLAALVVVSGLIGAPWPDLLPFLPRLRPVKGRMTRIDLGQPFELIVDYAHTPSSFEAILPPLRKRVQGKIICLFGSAGERDREKRPQQGRIAAAYCDVLVLCDEDPRGEDPLALLEEIASGCPELERGARLFLIPDRPAAMRKAFSLALSGIAVHGGAAPENLVLLLGKGHENSIIYADHSIPYDEMREAEKALRELGYGTASSGGGAQNKETP
jgi:UDP-N-acetylmuramoyl-L-alanyl-D-glutamate--2,6-diaminopimelate ligase